MEILYGIESRLDAIEEILDTLEDEHDVNAEKFREVLGKVWTEYHHLEEHYIK